MSRNARFRLVPAPAAVTAPVTKFGGQPVWAAPPAWPTGRESGRPMRFLGQIALPGTIFPGGGGLVAYVFFEDTSEPVYGDAFAVVLQAPGRSLFAPSDASPTAAGPTLYVLDEGRNQVPAEFIAEFDPETVEPAVPVADRYSFADLDYAAGYTFSRPGLAGNKVGGQPLHVEGLDTPPAEFGSPDWRLLVQLAPDSGYWGPRLTRNFYPFHLELGEFGLLTVFLAADYSAARIFVQQP